MSFLFALSPPQLIWLKGGEKKIIRQQLRWNKTSRLAAFFNIRMLNSLTWILCFPPLISHHAFIIFLYKNTTKTVALRFMWSYICSSVTAAWKRKCGGGVGWGVFYSMFWMIVFCRRKGVLCTSVMPMIPEAVASGCHRNTFNSSAGGGDDEGSSGSPDRQHLKSKTQGEKGRVRAGEKEWLANLTKMCVCVSFFCDMKDFGERQSQKLCRWIIKSLSSP